MMMTMLFLHPGHGLDAFPSHHGENALLLVCCVAIASLVYAAVRK